MEDTHCFNCLRAAKPMSDSSKPDLILVVDDSPTVLQVAEFVLTRAGFEVASAASGGEALKLAGELEPKLILLDFAMPDLNGYDVCRELGEDENLQDIPIVIMNTRGDAVGDRFIREMGIIDHINKPFAPEALLAVVQHTLDKTRNTNPGLLRRPLLWEQQDDPSQPHMPAAERIAIFVAQAIGDMERGPERLAEIRSALQNPDLKPALSTLSLEGEGPRLIGDLSVVPLAEILQLLQLQRQTGQLSVRRGQTEISISFKDGEVRLVTGINLPDEYLLGSVLVREKLMEPRELEVLLNNRRGTRQRLGSQMVKLGYLEPEQLHHALRLQSSELTYAMLRWSSGSFAFSPQEELPEEVLEFDFGLGIDELLMEGFRRVDEWGLIEDALPSFQAVLEPTGHTPDTLSEEEETTLELVDGKRTVEELVHLMGSGTFQSARLLYRLVASRAAQVRNIEPKETEDETARNEA